MDPNTNNKNLRIKHQTGLRRIPGTTSTGVEQGVTSLSITSYTQQKKAGTASCTQQKRGGTTSCIFTLGIYKVQHYFLDTEKGRWHRFFNTEEER